MIQVRNADSKKSSAFAPISAILQIYFSIVQPQFPIFHALQDLLANDSAIEVYDEGKTALYQVRECLGLGGEKSFSDNPLPR
jgi:hypothetical protein